uniref:Probable RNA-binding protein 19 n=1 Tax=Cyprinus carpio TaxID=7962 RepID=A0A8C1QML3_CYPCA
MSRLIVKNLPNGMKEERFHKMFADFGTLTDCTLKFTKDGRFRKFGFVGFKTEEDAKKAMKHFNKSFVDTSRVTVEFCTDIGDPNKARPWSKHTRLPSSNKVTEEQKSCEQAEKREKVIQLCPLTLSMFLEKDQSFQEFLSVHHKRTQVPTWANDTAETTSVGVEKKKEEKKQKAAVRDDYLNFDSDESEEFSDDEGADEEGKQAKNHLLAFRQSQIVLHNCDFSFSPNIEPSTEFTVKLRGAPFNVTEQQVKEFMVPLKPVAIRFGKNTDGRKSGYVYVDLRTEAEVERALRFNKDYMGGRYIEVFRVNNFKNDRRSAKRSEKERNFVHELRDDEEEEDVAESGRLFVRNLPYTCTEEELKEVFIKYGPLSEVLFPIDSLTKKPKGFAFVSYMIPENAVSALAQLDGHVFQGRVLHVMASRLKKEKPDQGANAPGSSSYKRQKDAKDKAASGSSHNWNTLFLGTSAVADAIAQKYNTTKSQVLDHSDGSLAVRMALGETQIVQETRQFLLDNGVSLDSFSQAAGQRSNSVILVKNLPTGVQVAELEALFSPHGSLGRVLLPPSGLTAIVEFLEPTEAKRAFMKLAFTKFQHVPLYLEWAPVAVFTTPKAPKPEEEEEEEEEEDEEELILPGSTLFIKNLNFNTSEETLREVSTFSKCGVVKSCTISKKSDKAGKLSSMGYGFVRYKTPEAAQKAMRQLQHCKVDEHQLELKISERERKKQTARKQTTSKILVRNIPFQATVKELRELFCTFGELKTVRLPKKGIGGAHRGFGFIDFLTKQDAKKAFTALCHSTHLYGRRLVLEWADAEETVDDLRRKTAQHFHGKISALYTVLVPDEYFENQY